jgi:hypothetical protein
MSEVKVNKLSPRSGTTVTIGDSGDTINIVGTLQNNGAAIPGDISSVVAGTGLSGGGTSGDVTINIEAAQPTITSTGTLTGFTSTGIDDNADATAMTITSAEKVGIGETVPLGQLHVKSGDSGVSSPDITDLVVECSGSGGMSLLGATNGQVEIAFGDSGDANIGRIAYNHDNNFLATVVNANEVMRITSGGSVGIATSSPEVPLSVLGSDTQIHFNETSASGGGYLMSESAGQFRISGGAGYKVGGSGWVAKSTEAVIIGHDSGGDIKFFSNTGLTAGNTFTPSERMRINSSGNVGIGVSSPSSTVHISGNPQVQLTQPNNLVLQNDTDSATSGDAKTGILFRANYSGSTPTDLANITAGKENATNNNYGSFISFHTRTNGVNELAERMRITSGGTVFVSNTSEPSGGDNGAQISNSSYHIFCRNTSGAAVFRTFGSSGEFRTLGNGNAQNTNNSYGAISDRVLKENEVDASSQWNDIKSLQIKHYNFKSKPNEKQLGVIAQDLEASGMNGLVENNQDELYTEDDVLPEGKNIGDVKLKNYKSVKYSILYMKSVKALQEAMTRIESLEAEVTALKNQP